MVGRSAVLDERLDEVWHRNVGVVARSSTQVSTAPSHADGEEWAGAALEAALAARAPGVHASTPMVRQLALQVGRELGLDAQFEAHLDLAVRVRDVGMIALPDSVALATTPLSPADWELVNRHPVIGAQLIERLEVVAFAAPLVRSHHERWDGGGYPDGLAGEEIPLLSRVLATCDAFVSMASDRPHRRGMGAETALEQVDQGRGSQFDPAVVDALVAVLRGNGAAHAGARPPRPEAASAVRPVALGTRGATKRSRLTSAIEELDVVPVFAPAQERVLAATTTDGATGGELVAAIESDTGLTVAILRRAQEVSGRRPIANVADAVAALSPAEIAAAVGALPRTEFPWRTSQIEVLMHQSRVHALAVTRAADRIARESGAMNRDDILVAALLHDVGKLVLGRAHPDYGERIDTHATSPEKRVHEEQRELGTNHATLSGLMIHRWGLPEVLARPVAAHHTAEAEDDVATYVRLADMIAHHAQGDTVDRAKMLRLCGVCGISANQLRDVLFDLPHSGGSERRRAEPSPLSPRETTVLRILAQGKVYKVIADELGLSTSTVRSHLHKAYEKLGVADRAQAVLRATEMGWI
ncbi:MAG TPA: HD domain-containing phosphohydrolase [Solirubrobacteraceae bacterium]|nr:HD domain-containing phosphohydrolase [Solirubrobacteraceae bacterium]